MGSQTSILGQKTGNKMLGVGGGGGKHEETPEIDLEENLPDFLSFFF